jgi:hypothetical protein
MRDAPVFLVCNTAVVLDAEDLPFFPSWRRYNPVKVAYTSGNTAGAT